MIHEPSAEFFFCLSVKVKTILQKKLSIVLCKMYFSKVVGIPVVRFNLSDSGVYE